MEPPSGNSARLFSTPRTYGFVKVDRLKTLHFRACAWYDFKLDGVAPLITDPPQTSFTTLSKEKKYLKNIDTRHVTSDM